ncbi:MAG: ribose-phosphate diphosphokinase [Thermoprotei archaeon]
MIVLGGPAHNGIGKNLARLINAEFYEVEHKVFPDGESYVRIPIDVMGKDVIVVQSTYYPQDKHIIELLLMTEALDDLKANSVTAVVPYLAYSRQDRRFRHGEALSVKTVLQVIRKSGANALIVVEPHHYDALSHFEGDARAADPMPELAAAFKDVKDAFVLAPDKGALERAQRFAEALGVEFDHLEKLRDRVTGQVSLVTKPTEKIKGKSVIIVDDIISTGDTMALAAKAAYDAGAKEVLAAAVHGLFVSKDSVKKLKDAGIKRIVVTNTIPQSSSEVEVVDVSPAIARKI